MENSPPKSADTAPPTPQTHSHPETVMGPRINPLPITSLTTQSHPETEEETGPTPQSLPTNQTQTGTEEDLPIITHPTTKKNTVMDDLPFEMLQVLSKYLDPLTSSPLATLSRTWRRVLEGERKTDLVVPLPYLLDGVTGSIYQSHVYLLRPRDGLGSPWVVRLVWSGRNPTLLDPTSVSSRPLLNLIPPSYAALGPEMCLVEEVGKMWCFHVDGKQIPGKVVGLGSVLDPAHFTALGLFNGKLMLFSGSENLWSDVDVDTFHGSIQDIVAHQGHFYVLWGDCTVGCLVDNNVKNLDVTLTSPPPRIPNTSTLNLVSSTDGLYLVLETSMHLTQSVRGRQKNYVWYYDVYHLNVAQNAWDRVLQIPSLFLMTAGFAFEIRGLNENRIISFSTTQRVSMNVHDSKNAEKLPLPEGCELLSSVSFPRYKEIIRLFDVGSLWIKMYYEMEPEEKNAVLSLFFPPPAWVLWTVKGADPTAASIMLNNLRIY